MSPLKSSGPHLSRSRRSASLLVNKRSSIDLLNHARKDQILSASEREETVQLILREEADKVMSLLTSSQQDKARSQWVRRW